MSAITTHVLDISAGAPAVGVPIKLERETAEGWEVIGSGETNDDGRLTDLLPPDTYLRTGRYRLTFDTDWYFSDRQMDSFYPYVVILFYVIDVRQHYHVPLLLSPFGYSTYLGS
jgi:5-hydroxyisourate hydrolase